MNMNMNEYENEYEYIFLRRTPPPPTGYSGEEQMYALQTVIQKILLRKTS